MPGTFLSKIESNAAVTHGSRKHLVADECQGGLMVDARETTELAGTTWYLSLVCDTTKLPVLSFFEPGCKCQPINDPGTDTPLITQL